MPQPLEERGVRKACAYIFFLVVPYYGGALNVPCMDRCIRTWPIFHRGYEPPKLHLRPEGSPSRSVYTPLAFTTRRARCFTAIAADDPRTQAMFGVDENGAPSNRRTVGTPA